MTDTTTNTKTIEERVMEIPKEEVVKLTIPVKTAIREAGKLQSYATEDKEALIARGLAPEKIEELGVRADFLSDKETIWTRKYDTGITNTKAWDEKVAEASLLQRELKHDFQFAFRNNKEALRRLKKVTDGRGNDDLAQDMSDYPGLGAEYPDELAAIKFDNNKLVRANELSDELNNLLRVVNGAQNSSLRPEKEMRDRAYTYLKLLVDEIRSYGKYAFWNDEEKQRRYASEYLRNNREKSSKDKIEE